MKNKIASTLAALVGLTFCAHAALAACPISECNYLDPQYTAAYAKYKVAFRAYSSCVNPVTETFLSTMDRLAILYPRFGIAYRAMQDEIKAAQSAFGTANAAIGAKTDAASINYATEIATEATAEAALSAAADEESRRVADAHQRFDDRILRTAEPDALEIYNLSQLKVRQQAQRCGPVPPMPEPPRK